MADARLRGEWLGTIRFDDLSDEAWRVFSSALMWSVENGSNGFIPNRYLIRLHPDGAKPLAVEELVGAELWNQVQGGHQLIDWDGALGQSTAIEVETYKANARGRAKKSRDRTQKKLAQTVGFVDAPGESPRALSDVLVNVRPHVPPHVGKAQAKASRDMSNTSAQEIVNLETGEVTSPEVTTSWAVTPMPGSSNSESVSTPPKSVSTPADLNGGNASAAVYERVNGRTRRVQKSA